MANNGWTKWTNTAKSVLDRLAALEEGGGSSSGQIPADLQTTLDALTAKDEVHDSRLNGIGTSVSGLSERVSTVENGLSTAQTDIQSETTRATQAEQALREAVEVLQGWKQTMGDDSLDEKISQINAAITDLEQGGYVEKIQRIETGLNKEVQTDRNAAIQAAITTAKNELEGVYVKASDMSDYATKQSVSESVATEESRAKQAEQELQAAIDNLPTTGGTPPDEEDITKAQEGDGEVLKFKDKEYAPENFSGLGRVYLRKNIVDGKNVLTQAMVSNQNTIYVLQYDYSIPDGQTVTFATGSVLQFDGGSISGGLLNLNGAELRGDVNITSEPDWDEYDEFDEGYKAKNTELNVKWFGAKGDGVNDDSYALKRAIKWLKKNGATLVFPKGVYVHGDGLKDSPESPRNTIHTGYSYESDNSFITGDWTGVSSRKLYGETMGINLGRDISLTFFRFTNLTIEGNGSTVISHANNGYCKHNELFRFTGCPHLYLRNIIIDGNRENRPEALQLLGDVSFGNEFVTYADVMGCVSLKANREASTNWGGGVKTDHFRGIRQVQNLCLEYCDYARVENVVSRNSLMDGIQFYGSPGNPTVGMVITNCVFEHSSRHNLTSGGSMNCMVSCCTMQYAGLKIDKETALYVPKSTGVTAANVDLEAEGDPINGVTAVNEGITLDNCAFRKAYRSNGDVIITAYSKNCLITRSTFSESSINMVDGVSAFNNEVSFNTFYNGVCTFYQEGSNVHHNIFKFKDYVAKTNGEGAFIPNTNFEYSSSFVLGHTQSRTASLVPSRFCDNLIDCTWSGNTLPTSPPLFRGTGNFVVVNNVFKNVHGTNTSLGVVYLTVKEAHDNTVIREIDGLKGDVTFIPWTLLKTPLNITNPTPLSGSARGYRSWLEENNAMRYEIDDNFGASTRYLYFNPAVFYFYRVKVVVETGSAKTVATCELGSGSGLTTYVACVHHVKGTMDCTAKQHRTGGFCVKITGERIVHLSISVSGQNARMLSNSVILFSDPTTSLTYSDAIVYSNVANTLPALYTSLSSDRPVVSLGLKKMCAKNANGEWYTSDGWPVSFATRGATRPTGLTSEHDGFEFYDTTLHKKIHWDGAQWVDAVNTPV